MPHSEDENESTEISSKGRVPNVGGMGGEGWGDRVESLGEW